MAGRWRICWSSCPGASPDWSSAGCWKRGAIKTIVYSDGSVEAFDLERDPDELAPLELSREQIRQAVEEAEAWWSAHPIEAEPAEPLSDELIRNLEQMGYG